ncbi:MAG: hypothetical protein EOP83_04955 [Verrucomicrobiaceae bacterium]|nr:MAG: hypothetical protein EOP83_04955 [Verrucomicrobiaceae bacterium]
MPCPRIYHRLDCDWFTVRFRLTEAGVKRANAWFQTDEAHGFLYCDQDDFCPDCLVAVEFTDANTAFTFRMRFT